jgi:hypothetical protein
MARPQYLVSTRRFTPAYRRKRIEEFLIATEPFAAIGQGGETGRGSVAGVLAMQTGLTTAMRRAIGLK